MCYTLTSYINKIKGHLVIEKEKTVYVWQTSEHK